MDERASLRKNERIAWRIIEEEGILVDPDQSEVIHLNEVAALIWKLVDGKRTVAEIVCGVCEEFDVDEAIAERDVREFLDRLIDAGAVSK